MPASRLLRVSAAGLASAGMILFVGAGAALGATTIGYTPPTAAPGTNVTISNACAGVTDSPSASLRAAFVLTSSNLAAADPAVPKAVAHATSRPGTFVVTVPRLEPGDYDIRLECLPGDWRTNTAEGGTTPLSVHAAPPDTSTERPEKELVPAGGHEALLALIASLAGVAGVVAYPRTRLSRARRRKPV